MLRISDAAFEYLRLQKGSLDKFARNRAEWERQYAGDLLRTYGEIKPFLPTDCWGFLDIGSGLGGIDILISRHYRENARPGSMVAKHGPFVNLLDGEDDPPEMKLHRQTFNSMAVARQFHIDNGIESSRFAYYTPTAHKLPKPYDLVVSFGSWCFHYEPQTYLPLLTKGSGLASGSIVIADLRRDKPDWEAQLFGVGLRVVAVVRDSLKFRRLIMEYEGK